MNRRRLAALIEQGSSTAMLDVECGEAAISLYLAERGSHRRLDLSPTAIGLARTDAAKHGWPTPPSTSLTSAASPATTTASAPSSTARCFTPSCQGARGYLQSIVRAAARGLVFRAGLDHASMPAGPANAMTEGDFRKSFRTLVNRRRHASSPLCPSCQRAFRRSLGTCATNQMDAFPCPVGC